MLFLHICGGLSSKAFRTDLGFFTVVASNLVLFISNLSILRITQFWEPACARAALMLKLSESQGDTTVPKPEEAIDFVQLSCCY